LKKGREKGKTGLYGGRGGINRGTKLLEKKKGKVLVSGNGG